MSTMSYVTPPSLLIVTADRIPYKLCQKRALHHNKIKGLLHDSNITKHRSHQPITHNLALKETCYFHTDITTLLSLIQKKENQALYHLPPHS